MGATATGGGGAGAGGAGGAGGGLGAGGGGSLLNITSSTELSPGAEAGHCTVLGTTRALGLVPGVARSGLRVSTVYHPSVDYTDLSWRSAQITDDQHSPYPGGLDNINKYSCYLRSAHGCCDHSDHCLVQGVHRLHGSPHCGHWTPGGGLGLYTGVETAAGERELASDSDQIISIIAGYPWSAEDLLRDC